MTTPDVRVRLSAEGVAEVVSALKKIQGEAASTSAKGSKSFGGLNSALGGMKNMLVGLGAAFSIHAMANWIGQSIEAADRTGELAEQVGASVENLSALTSESVKFGVNADAMGDSLSRMNRYLGELREGSPEALELFRNMGLSAKDFDGKDAVESLELVAGGMGALQNNSQKTEAAMTIFGRSGARLIPLLQDIADKGFDRIKETAKAAGVVLTDMDVQTVGKLADDLDVLKRQATTLGVNFAAGMAPQVSQALAMISGNMGDANEGAKMLGQGFGFVMKVLALLAIPVEEAGTRLAQLAILLTGAGTAMVNFIKGNRKQAREDLRIMKDAIDEADRKLREHTQARLTLLMKKPEDVTAAPRPTRDDAAVKAEAARIRKLRLAAEKQQADALLSLQKSEIKARESADRRAYEDNLLSLREWYQSRRKAIEDGTKAEIAALGAARAEASAIDDPATRAAALDRIAKQEIELIRARDDAIEQSHHDEAKAAEDLQKSRLDAEAKISAARGQDHAQRLAEIEEEAAAYSKVLTSLGVPQEERDVALASFRQALVASAEFERQLTEAQRAMSALEAERSRIAAQTDAGNKTQMEGERALLELERQRQPLLRKMAADLLIAAEATGNPEAIARAREYADAVAAAGPAIESLHTYLVKIGDAAEQSGIRRLTDYFAEGISAAGGLRSMLQGLAADIRRVASELLAAKIVGWFSGLSLASIFSGGGGRGPLGDIPTGGPAQAASGGLYRGPGTTTSDSNLIRVSNMEYIMPAKVVQHPGVLEHLEDLRRGLAGVSVRPIRSGAGFAGGGLVAGGGAAGKSGSLLIGLEQGLILKAIESPEGQDLIVRSMARHRRTVQHLAAR